MSEFERGFLTVMVLCGVLMLLGHKRRERSGQPVPVKSESPPR